LAQACANLLISTGHIGRPNNGLIPVWHRANTQGAWDMGLRPAVNLKTTMGAAKALYLAGVDPVGDDPALGGAIQDAQFVVVQELFLTDTAKLADVVLPVQGFTEREGSFTSGERRVQRFYPAVPARGSTRPDYAITAQIAAGLEVELAGRAASLVFKRIAAQVADYEGLTYQHLARVVEQWPFTGHDPGERYYGGTAYHNSQGLGVQLKTAAQRGETSTLAWPESPALPVISGDQLLAVPVTRLYDRGRTLTPTQFLHPRLAAPHVVLHPEDAARLGIELGTTVHVHLNGTSTAVGVEINEALPAGVALVPRSLGMPIHGPMPVAIKVPVETG
jgi:NADH-quinone oxidoreductase subunit G